jgi:hypothetical protein
MFMLSETGSPTVYPYMEFGRKLNTGDILFNDE